MSITENLEKMLASGRDDPMLRFGLGSAYFNQGDNDAAVLHLQNCIEQAPSYTAAYKLLGKALVKLDRNEEARQVFNEGLPLATAQGDKQTQREIEVFLKKLA